ncbi:MAG: GNAT family N-acetyltransferase [Burkholderiales bacterium]|nr:GNAT family N-acetyltransferase [Burkholderiales bacterium]
MTPIRLATPEDAPPIATLSRDLIEIELGWSYTPRRVLGLLRQQETCSIVADDGGGIAGFAIMSFHDEHAHLALLAVAPRRQGSGIGSRLLAWLEDSARTAGLFTIHAEVRSRNTSARKFYRARGYVERCEMLGYYRGLESAIRLEHDLRCIQPHTTPGSNP